MLPLDLVSQMVLDNGARWGECATPEQWADMRALLEPGGPRRHFWLRSRGFSKTFDAGAATLAMMLAAGGIGPATSCTRRRRARTRRPCWRTRSRRSPGTRPSSPGRPRCSSTG